MAYICGLLNKDERKALEARGWDVEPCPAELIPAPDPQHPEEEPDPEDYAMVWVDASMFEVMSGPDWEK